MVVDLVRRVDGEAVDAAPVDMTIRRAVLAAQDGSPEELERCGDEASDVRRSQQWNTRSGSGLTLRSILRHASRPEGGLM